MVLSGDMNAPIGRLTPWKRNLVAGYKHVYIVQTNETDCCISTPIIDCYVQLEFPKNEPSSLRVV